MKTGVFPNACNKNQDLAAYRTVHLKYFDAAVLVFG